MQLCVVVFLVRIVLAGSKVAFTPSNIEKGEFASIVTELAGSKVAFTPSSIEKGEFASIVNELVERKLTAWPFNQRNLDITTLGKRGNVDIPCNNEVDKKALSKHGIDKADTSRKDKNAIGGDAKIVGPAAAGASVIEVLLLLPLNTVQTRMQASGLALPATMRAVFECGPLNGVQQLYKALPPTMALLAMRAGLIFGSASALKKQLPNDWPEMMQDGIATAISAGVCTAALFPMDTLKTRLQVGRSLPQLSQLYRGFTPEMAHRILQKSLWVVTRNGLECNLPDSQDPVLQNAKHFICGGLTGVAVTCVVFPFDTLKKRLQMGEGAQLISEAMTLFKAGGLARFYPGLELKFVHMFAQSAIFNVGFVACSKALETLCSQSDPT